MKKIQNLADILDCGQNPNKTAVIDLESLEAKSYSYKELRDYSNAVAHGLINQGIVLGDKVAIVSDNSVRFLFCLFGIMKIGAVAVLVDNTLNQEQIKIILKDCEARLVFTDTGLDSQTLAVDINLELDNFIKFGDFENYIPTGSDSALILYTSGTTTDPKGALISHAGHGWALERHMGYDTEWGRYRISLISAPLYHANGLSTSEVSLAGGGTIVVLPKFNARRAITAIEEFNINTLFGVPTMFAMMLQEKDLLETCKMNSVRAIRSASSSVSQKLLDGMKQFFPNATFFNAYGITEVGAGLFGPHPDGLDRPSLSVGHPAKGIEYRIVNGILEIKSPSMMTSYSSNALPITEDGFFVTNDLFKIDENGFYYFIGRADDMFKCGGKRIYPTEVSSILETHPSVNSSYVISLPDEIKGHKPYAFVVLEKETSVTEKELKDYFLSQGQAYQHPRRIWFLNQLPLTGTNKVDKKYLIKTAMANLATEQ